MCSYAGVWSGWGGEEEGERRDVRKEERKKWCVERHEHRIVTCFLFASRVFFVATAPRAMRR